VSIEKLKSNLEYAISGQNLTAPLPSIFRENKGAVIVSPLPFFPIEKKRSFTRKKPKMFFAFGEIKGGGAVRWVCPDDIK
jgi:hypothetical protein